MSTVLTDSDEIMRFEANEAARFEIVKDPVQRRRFKTRFPDESQRGPSRAFLDPFV